MERLQAIGPLIPTSETPSVVVEACGLLCPLPLVKTARAFNVQPAGALLELRADDPAAVVDVPEWCDARNHVYLGVAREGRLLRFFLRKCPD
jgi:tRNA 2-thiouridine synthesizing protein A